VLIDLDNVTPGMKIADDVMLPTGGVLVKAPVVLTEPLIVTLRKHEIRQVEIEPAESPATAGPSHQQAEEAADPLPRIEISVSADAMSASLRLMPGSEQSGHLTVEHLYRALADHGILYGIDEKRLTETVEKWHKIKRLYDITDVASGKAPVPGHEGSLRFETKHITDPAHLEAARNADHCWQLLEIDPPIQQVTPGMTIARRQSSIPPAAGTTVHGDEVHTDEVIAADVRFDDSVKVADNGRDIVAAVEGLAYFVKNTVGIVPIDFNGTAEVAVAPDRMSATLTIRPALEGGTLPAENAIRALLAEKNITHGIREDVLVALRPKLAGAICPDEPEVIAQGTAAIDGENGRVEFLFTTETTLAPKENDDGTVDYKNVDIVQSVAAGTELARLVPPGEGTPGVTIFGEELPCRGGTAAHLPVGPNTQPHPRQEEVLIASTDGIVRYDGKVVEVSEGYVIDGDVDFSTGNVKYEKSVVIAGDVKSGFTVECGGDLQVGGTIEDARINCGGNVLCKHGFVGSGKGSIEANGDVNIGFLKNQTVRARGNVAIARESMNSTIYTRKSITVNGHPLSVAGGMLVARNSILLYTVGNTTGIRTTLEVGLDYTLIEEFDKTEHKIGEIRDTYQKLLETGKKYERLRAIKRKLPPKEEFLFTKLRHTVSKYDQQIKALEERKKMIQAKMHDLEKAYIKVDHTVMPGTMIKIGERFFLVREEIVGPKTIRLVRHEIRAI
jgi:hypothetical protein